MIGPTDLLHPSPAPHFKTFQAYSEKSLTTVALCDSIHYVYDHLMLHGAYWVHDRVHYAGRRDKGSD